MWTSEKIRNSANLTAFKWAAVLFIIGSIYIYGTDALLDQYFDDLSIYRTFQTYKGIVFCGLIALILFFTIRHLLIKIDTEQQEVKKGRRFAERIQNSIPGIFFVLDEAGRLIRWNDNTNTISGLSDKELKHLHALESVETSDKNKADNALQEIEGKGEIETELNLKTRSESERLYKITASRFNNDGNQFIVGTGIDITQENELNEKIKRQNYQLKTAQEMAKLGYWESNLSTSELTWSNIVYELFGLDPDAFTPTIDKLLDLIHPDDKSIHEENIEKLKKNENFESEYRVIKPNGEISWFRETGEVYARKDNKPLILHGVVLDITAQKHHEKNIKRSYVRGENKERKRISNELHDGIAQYLSAALLHLDNTKELLENNNGSTQLSYARELVEKAVSETRTISQNLMPQTIERHGIISAVKLLIRQYQLSSNIQIYFDYNIESEWSVNQEIETNLYRIVQELLSNAVRHSGCDKIWIEILKNTDHTICNIIDNGRGLKMNEVRKSKGLGLQSIKDRVELLSGSIEFNNISSQGLAVHIVIPVT